MAAKTQKLPKDVLKFADCKFFVEKNCSKSADECLFRHFQKAKDTEKTCNAWKNEFSCRNMTCPYRHTAPDKKPDKPKPKPASTEAAPVVMPTEWSVHPSCKYASAMLRKPRLLMLAMRGSFTFGISRTALYLKERLPLKLLPASVMTLAKERKKQHSAVLRTFLPLQKYLSSLDYAHVKLVHVPDRKPGAADKKILLELNQFERDHKPPATVVLISGDIDFIQHLIVLKGLGYNVIVIHNRQAKPELKTVASKAYSWESFAKTSSNNKPATSDTPNNNNSPAKKKGEANNKPKAENNNSANPKPTKGNNTSNSKPKGAKQQQAPNGNKQREGERKAGNKKAKGNNPEAFKCQVCNLVAPSKKVLKQHLTTSHQYCTNCDKPFASPEALHQHNTTKHPRCPHCSKTFLTPQAVQQHIEAKHPNFNCEVCDKSFPSEDAWEKHKDTKEHWRCGACERTFAVRTNLWQHQSDTGHDNESDSDSASGEEIEEESVEEKSPGAELIDIFKQAAQKFFQS